MCRIPKASRWWEWLYKNKTKIPFEKSNSTDISTSPIEMIISMIWALWLYSLQSEMRAMSRRLVCFILKCWILFLSFVIRCDDTCGMLQWMHCMQTDYKYWIWMHCKKCHVLSPFLLHCHNFKCHDILQNICVKLSSIFHYYYHYD